MSEQVAFQHKGWFGICPVYFADLETGCPQILERHVLFAPLMTASEWFMRASIFVMSFMSDDYEPHFPLRVTGTIDPPLVVQRPA